LRWFAAAADHVDNLSGNHHGPGAGTVDVTGNGPNGADAGPARYNHDHNHQFTDNTVTTFRKAAHSSSGLRRLI
jgi:hypothetical protein